MDPIFGLKMCLAKLFFTPIHYTRKSFYYWCWCFSCGGYCCLCFCFFAVVLGFVVFVVVIVGPKNLTLKLWHNWFSNVGVVYVDVVVVVFFLFFLSLSSLFSFSLSLISSLSLFRLLDPRCFHRYFCPRCHPHPNYCPHCHCHRCSCPHTCTYTVCPCPCTYKVWSKLGQ